MLFLIKTLSWVSFLRRQESRKLVKPQWEILDSRLHGNDSVGGFSLKIAFGDTIYAHNFLVFKY